MYTQDMDKGKRPKQRTPKGHEIPVPQREEFLRNLKKTAKPLTRKRRPKK